MCIRVRILAIFSKLNHSDERLLVLLFHIHIRRRHPPHPQGDYSSCVVSTTAAPRRRTGPPSTTSLLVRSLQLHFSLLPPLRIVHVVPPLTIQPPIHPLHRLIPLLLLLLLTTSPYRSHWHRRRRFCCCAGGASTLLVHRRRSCGHLRRRPGPVWSRVPSLSSCPSDSPRPCLIRNSGSACTKIQFLISVCARNKLEAHTQTLLRSGQVSFVSCGGLRDSAALLPFPSPPTRNGRHALDKGERKWRSSSSSSLDGG